MRHVIPAYEVCQAWVAMDEQQYAHTQTRNLSFTSFDELRSYNTAIASRLVSPSTGWDIIFVTRNNYSVTTNKQLRDLSRAIDPIMHDRLIHVPYKVPMIRAELPHIWKEMVDEVQVIWQKAERARTRRSYYLSEGNDILQDANRIVELFDLEITDGIIIEKMDDMNEMMRVYNAQIKLRA